MDQNKEQKLRDIGYEINQVCGLCKYSLFPNNDWGTCSLHVYDHKKHDGIHQLSIHKLGYCPEFSQDSVMTQPLIHYQEFFQFNRGD